MRDTSVKEHYSRDNSVRGYLGQGTTQLEVTSLKGQLSQRIPRSRDNSVKGHLAQGTTQSEDTSVKGQLSQRIPRSRDNSVRGYLDQGTTQSEDTSVKGQLRGHLAQGTTQAQVVCCLLNVPATCWCIKDRSAQTTARAATL